MKTSVKCKSSQWLLDIKVTAMKAAEYNLHSQVEHMFMIKRLKRSADRDFPVTT